MIDDAARDPALVESPVWMRFCEAERAAERGDLTVAVAGWEALYFEFERHPWIEYIELVDSIARRYVDLQRWDSAIEWLEREAVMRREEHGEVDAWGARRDIADVLIRAGRTEEAAEIYEENRVATPDDIWLYNGAALGWLYSGHDGAAALPWIEEAIAVAERTGDPERLLDQLERLKREAIGD